MPVQMIYARSENHCIGKDGGIPWKIPADMAHFRDVTMPSPVIMGRKTYESIGRPLPGRLNVVLSRRKRYKRDPAVLLRDDLDAALDEFSADGADCFVIGGAELYAAAFDRCKVVHETLVRRVVDGDTFIDPFDFRGFTTSWERHSVGTTECPWPYTTFRHVRN